MGASEEESKIFIRYTLDKSSSETAKKLDSDHFRKSVSKDYQLIKSHKIKSGKSR